MRHWHFALAVLCAGLVGAVWMHWPARADDEVAAYRKLPPAGYWLVRADAMAYAATQRRQGLTFHTRTDGAGSFEIRCRGVVVMAVENTPARVLLRMPPDGLDRAPDVARLRESLQRWMKVDPSHVPAVAQRGEPSWLAARLRRAVEGVPHREQCLHWGGRPVDPEPFPGEE